MDQDELLEIDGADDGAGGLNPPPPDPTPPAAKEDANQQKEDPTVTVAELRRELREARERERQATQTAQFWAQRAQGDPATAQDKSGSGERTEEEIQADLVEMVSNNDVKGLKALLKTLGVATRDDIRAEIGATRQEITREGELYSKYPELKDKNSPLFKQAAAEYNRLKAADPRLASSPILLETAVDLAVAKSGGGAAGRRGAARAEESLEDDFEGQDEGYDEREEARVERVRTAAPVRDRRGRFSEDEGGETLSREQRLIVARFQAAGANITEDSYRQRAKQGVRMSGTPTRGRRG